LTTCCAHHARELRYTPLSVNVRSRQRRRRRFPDPTHTTGIRKAFERDMLRRFKKLRRDIVTTIAKNDAFGLRSGIRVNEPGRQFQFAFPRAADKVSAFMEWLQQQQNATVLELQRGATLRTAAERSWANVYIDGAYQRGIRQAGQELRAAGATVSDRYLDASFNLPVHADRVGLIYTRTYSDLRGITEAMDTQISRILAQGLIDGLGPMELARDIVDRVDGIGIARARTLARTEIIAAHAEASLNSYEEAGLEGVAVTAEFSTANDNAVCPECEELEGKTFLIEEARGVIPVHPNCRCAFIPNIEDARSIVLE
jgi:SPP1 gp7 family putative phage head morphogenesis protein